MTKVRDVMTGGTGHVAMGTTLSEALGEMRRQEVDVLPVCDEQHRLVGLVTLEDVAAHAASNGRQPTSAATVDRCSSPAVGVAPDAEVAEAWTLMRRHRIDRLPVVEDDVLVGTVRRRDLLRGADGNG